MFSFPKNKMVKLLPSAKVQEKNMKKLLITLSKSNVIVQRLIYKHGKKDKCVPG